MGVKKKFEKSSNFWCTLCIENCSLKAKQLPLNCNLCQKDAILTTLSQLFAVISHWTIFQISF